VHRSLVLLLLFAAATIVIAADGAMRPERKYLSLGFFFVGLLGTWRQFSAWRGARAGGAP
jgi:hypothetical protein